MMRSRFCFIFILLLLFAGSYAQPPRVKEVLKWSQKGYYILNPAIANVRQEIAFVRQLSGADSTVGADSFNTGVKASYIPASGISKRLFDPVVALLDVNTRHLSLIDYGWGPAFSTNDNRVAYACQLNPLQKQDKLYASAYTGNSIKVFNKTNHSIIEVAKPSQDYLLDPFFIDSLNIIYKTGTKVNGPYGAGISFNKVNLATRQTTLVHQPGIKYRMYELMGEPYFLGNKLACTVYSPADSESSLSGEYLHLLLNGKDTLHNFGIRRFTNLNYKFAYNSNNELLFLDDGYYMAEDTNYLNIYKNQALIQKKPLTFKYSKGYLSPDGKYMLYITQNLDAFLLNISNFKSTKIDIPRKEYHAVVWSRDGDKLAIVQDHEQYAGTDELYLFHIR